MKDIKSKCIIKEKSKCIKKEKMKNSSSKKCAKCSVFTECAYVQCV